MAYAIMRINKIKTTKEADSRYKHNFRIYDVGNADTSRSYLNFEPVDLCGKDYNRVSREEITRMKIEGAITKNIRKDAVIGCEVLLTYSYEKENLDLGTWVEKNVEWLQNTFNPSDKKIAFEDPDTGEIRELKSDNVKSVVVHMDEEVPHIHAYVVPIDDKGHLNAKYYMSDRVKMSQLQSAYAEAMKEFGLERGEQKSVATRLNMYEYHRLAKRAVESTLPAPEAGENIRDYHERVNKEYQTEKVHHAEDIRKLNQKINALSAELARTKESQGLEHERLGQETIKICAELGIDDASPERIREARHVIKKGKYVEEARDTYPDKDRYNRIVHDYQMLADYGRDYEQEKKKYK